MQNTKVDRQHLNNNNEEYNKNSWGAEEELRHKIKEKDKKKKSQTVGFYHEAKDLRWRARRFFFFLSGRHSYLQSCKFDFSPHAVIDVIVIESQEEAQDGEEYDNVGCYHQTRRTPHNLHPGKKKKTSVKTVGKMWKKNYTIFTTGVASGALAKMMGRPKADTTKTEVMNQAISLQGLVPPEASPYLLDITVGKGANK